MKNIILAPVMKTASGVGYVSLLGFAIFAFESRKLADAVASHRNPSTR